MRIVLGADHAGYAMKQAIAERLSAAGHTVVVVGPRVRGRQPIDPPLRQS
jgi:ribose 5-phosphate isomerase RpiB